MHAPVVADNVSEKTSSISKVSKEKKTVKFGENKFNEFVRGSQEKKAIEEEKQKERARVIITQQLSDYSESKYGADEEYLDLDFPVFTPGYYPEPDANADDGPLPDARELRVRLERLTQLAENIQNVKLFNALKEELNQDSEIDSSAHDDSTSTSVKPQHSLQPSRLVLPSANKSSSSSAKTPTANRLKTSAKGSTSDKDNKHMDEEYGYDDIDNDPDLIIEKTPAHLTTGIMSQMENFRKKLQGMKTALNELQNCKANSDLRNLDEILEDEYIEDYPAGNGMSPGDYLAEYHEQRYSDDED